MKGNAKSAIESILEISKEALDMFPDPTSRRVSEKGMERMVNCFFEESLEEQKFLIKNMIESLEFFKDKFSQIFVEANSVSNVSDSRVKNTQGMS